MSPNTNFSFRVRARNGDEIPTDWTDLGSATTLQQFTISGTVTVAGSPLPGVDLLGLPDTPTTDPNGHYSAAVDESWSGTATPTKAGYSFDPNSRTYDGVNADWTDQDYAADTGTLAVETKDQNDQAFAGPIFVDGEPKGTGSWSGELPIGTHTVSFGDIVGYITPPPQEPNVQKDGVTNVTGVYNQELSVLASADPNIIASGQSSTLKATVTGGKVPLSYAWSPPAGLSDPNVAEPVASPLTTTTYTATVTDDIGQTDTDQVALTVASAISAEAGDDKEIGQGGSTTLNGSASGGKAPYGCAWSPTSGLDDPNVAEPTASPTSTTTYTLTVTDDLGQTDTDQVTVTVASGVVGDAGADKEIGQGGTTTLNGSASGGKPPYRYAWSPTSGLDDPNAAEPTASPTSTTTYTLMVTDGLGQTDTDQVTVTIASGVVADAGDDKQIGQGGSTTLNGSASGGKPPYSYAWSPTTGLDNPTVANPTASPTNTTAYTLTVTDDLGQTDADQVTVTVGYRHGKVQFRSATYSIAENGGTKTITVSRVNGSDGEVTVDYATSNGTAQAGSDYTAASGTLTFGDGVTSRTFDVAVKDDGAAESDETVHLTLSNPTGGAKLGNPQSAMLKIEQDPNDRRNVRPSVTVNAPSANATVSAETSSFLCSGTAYDTDGQIVGVLCRVGDGSWSSAEGTTIWAFTVELKEGKNEIQIRSWDDQGDYSETVVRTITRSSPSVAPAPSPCPASAPVMLIGIWLICWGLTRTRRFR